MREKVALAFLAAEGVPFSIQDANPSRDENEGAMAMKTDEVIHN